jgi:DNA-binding XRE family transcriptional regulator
MLIRNANALGQLIRDRRRHLGWSQGTLAERIGASRFWVGAVERGKPSAEVGLVPSAIQALGMTVDVHSAVREAAIRAPGAPQEQATTPPHVEPPTPHP